MQLISALDAHFTKFSMKLNEGEVLIQDTRETPQSFIL